MRASHSLLAAADPLISHRSALVNIENATFYRHHPSSTTSSNPPLFPDLSISLPYTKQSTTKLHQYWAIIGPSSSGKTTFLEILRGQHLCLPPTARSFPYLSNSSSILNVKYSRNSYAKYRGSNTASAIQYVGFGGKGEALGGPDVQGAYLSARYESRRESTDFSLLDYLKGNTSLNPADKTLIPTPHIARKEKILEQAVESMNLGDLLDLPVGTLSNGQTRRARIAKALMARPKLLLLDEPFLGIDPLTQSTLSRLFWSLSRRSGPRVILTLLPQDEVPIWITHVLYLDAGCRVKFQGTKETVMDQARKNMNPINVGSQKPSMWKYVEKDGSEDLEEDECDSEEGNRRDGKVEKKPSIRRRWSYIKPPSEDSKEVAEQEALVEMKGVQVKYGERAVLGSWKQEVQGERKEGLWWNINRGDRWALFGPNGSGKTTILSLISSDHPQSYSAPIKLFGRSRLPAVSEPGVSVFDIQTRIGQASPEIYRFFPRKLTIRQTLESAWADTFLSKPYLTFERDSTIDACLRWFRHELDPTSSDNEPIDVLASETRDDSSTYTRRPRLHIAEYLSSDIDWADRLRLRDVSFSAQQVALFLRAIIKKPDLVILDEAFSGMDEATRIKCMLFLAHGETTWLRVRPGWKLADRPRTRSLLYKHGEVSIEGLEQRQALVCVSHRKEEVPPLVDRWMCLPEAGSGWSPRFGKIERGLTLKERKRMERTQAEDWWEDVWGKIGTKWPARRVYDRTPKPK